MLEPQEVLVPAGGKQEVSVVFKAEGAASYKQMVSIHISERDPADHPDGIPFELGGESCIPGGVECPVCCLRHIQCHGNFILQPLGLQCSWCCFGT
jgi:hypothetical protein